MDDYFAESLAARDMPAERAMGEVERLKLVLHVIEKLPRGERHVLLLSAIEELETAEVAKLLEKSESAVRALLFRARTRLRQRLERRGGAV